MRSVLHIGLPLLVILGLSGCSDANRSETTEPPSQSGSVTTDQALSETALRLEYGRELVTENCASCHAVGPGDDSPRMDAPPLRTVLSSYDADSLLMDFVEQRHVGAADMPDFNFGPKGTDAIIAYLMSIQSEE